jgi:uncharacterized protein YjiK
MQSFMHAWRAWTLLLSLEGAMFACCVKADEQSEPQANGPTTPVAAASTANPGALARYRLEQPTLVVPLPARLQEISGLTDLSNHEVVCVQDEEGVLFTFDLQQQQITRTLAFGEPGDYEGLTRVGERYFVLRSDGALFEVTPGPDRTETRIHALRLPTSNNEGLAFDARSHRLLIAPKSRLGKGREYREYKDIRAVFGFDLKTMTLSSGPVLELSVDAVRTFAERRGQPLPMKQKKKGDGTARVALRLMPSSVAVHPHTAEVFLLSAIDRVLASFDPTGKVTGFALLDAVRFVQPEGLTFLANGDMVITSEGKDRQATLAVFQWPAATP